MGVVKKKGPVILNHVHMWVASLNSRLNELCLWGGWQESKGVTCSWGSLSEFSGLSEDAF